MHWYPIILTPLLPPSTHTHVTSISSAVPSVPTITSINWINATGIQVTWTQLTLEESRGFITLYSVAYSTAERSMCSEMIIAETNTIVATGSENSQLVINNLDARLEYCIRIAASTMSGNSDFSNVHKVPCNVCATPPPATNGTDVATYQNGTAEILAICFSGLLLLIVLTAIIIIPTIFYIRRLMKGQTEPM